jgi:hypothetical protein
MKKVFFSLLAGILLAGMAAAQASGSASQSNSVSTGQSGGQVQSSTSASASQQGTARQGGNQLQAGSIIYAELGKSIDAKKAKPGDEVQAKATQVVLSQGKVVIPRGSKIIGHVTEAKPREKGQEQSSLGIAFDHAVLKDGTQVPLSGVSIQAIGNPQASAALAAQEDNPGMGGAATGMPSGGGMGGRPTTGGGVLGSTASTAGGVGNTAGGIANTAGGAVGTVAGTTQAGSSVGGHLGASSHGVVNMPGLSMSASAGNSTQGSVITSDKKNVKLDSGTEIVLKVNQ